MDYTLSGSLPNSGLLEIKFFHTVLIWDSVTNIVHFKCYKLNTQMLTSVENCQDK